MRHRDGQATAGEQYHQRLIDKVALSTGTIAQTDLVVARVAVKVPGVHRGITCAAIGADKDAGVPGEVVQNPACAAARSLTAVAACHRVIGSGNVGEEIRRASVVQCCAPDGVDNVVRCACGIAWSRRSRCDRSRCGRCSRSWGRRRLGLCLGRHRGSRHCVDYNALGTGDAAWVASWTFLIRGRGKKILRRNLLGCSRAWFVVRVLYRPLSSPFRSTAALDHRADRCYRSKARNRRDYGTCGRAGHCGRPTIDGRNDS
nr:hypothetical protein CFP56_02885 [Quercus suber]